MLQKFLDYLAYELNRAPLTVDAYGRDIRQFMEWLSPDNPENTDFVSVSSRDIRAWVLHLSKSGDINRTTRRKLQSLRALYRWLQKTGKIKNSPLREIPLPKIPKPLPDLIRQSDIESAITYERGEWSDKPEDSMEIMGNLIVDMLFSLGIRRVELVGIDDSDISFSKLELKVLGKRSKERIIPLPPPLIENIKRWQKLRDLEYGKIGGDSPLFIYKGERIKPDKVYRIVHQKLEGAEAKKKSPHALRHSFASAMLNGGADLDSVREFLGHSSLSTTQIYTHISLKEIKKAYSSAHPRSVETKTDSKK